MKSRGDIVEDIEGERWTEGERTGVDGCIWSGSVVHGGRGGGADATDLSCFVTEYII